MSDRRTITTCIAGGALLGASLLVAPPALAGNQRATNPYGTFECSDGRTFDIYGMASPRFPIQVGFLDGKGVVGRWMHESYSAEIVAPAEIAALANPNPVEEEHEGTLNRSRGQSPADLEGLASCVSSGAGEAQYLITADLASMFGLDDHHIGKTVTIAEEYALTVWINASQVAKR